MKQKRLLVVGGGHADIPLILAARRLGFYVITTGNRADDLGHKFSDENVLVDFSDSEAVLDLALKLQVDAICPCCNDFSALSCAYAAEKLGIGNFDSYEVYKIIHHKDSYRKFAMENGILSPRADYFEQSTFCADYLNKISYPAIIKPVDLTGGKGVVRVDNKLEANIAVENAFTISREKRIVVEEFIEGSNHGFSCLLVNRKVVFYFVDNEHYYLNKYMVSGASTPSDTPFSAVEMIVAACEKMALHFNLKDGLLHIQFILKDGIPYILEVCRRPPGDLYVDLVAYATNINYAEYIVKSFAGMEIGDLHNVHSTGFWTRHCIMSDKPGVIDDVVFESEIENNIKAHLLWWKKGDEIVNHLVHKCGIVFLKFASLQEMTEKNSNINKLIRVQVNN